MQHPRPPLPRPPDLGFTGHRDAAGSDQPTTDEGIRYAIGGSKLEVATA
uniref:Uncharacterized protein n=1 Tax=Oryza punctata TaxID=4537 RepID=A0A0E0LV48_ORYPU